jgi:hypothetical protein
MEENVVPKEMENVVQMEKKSMSIELESTVSKQPVKTKKPKKIFSYLSKAFGNSKDYEDETEFQHTSEAEVELKKLEKKSTFNIPNKKKENGKAITSKDLSTDDRNLIVVKFSNVLLYNSFLLFIMLLVRIGYSI